MSMTTEMIEKLRHASFEIKEFYGEENEETKLLIEAADTIQLLSEKLHASQMGRSSQYYHSGWIPVSERLPEEWKSVLVCYKSQGGIAQCVSERLVNMDGSNRWSALCGQEPIAWMPLPEPWKEK